MKALYEKVPSLAIVVTFGLMTSAQAQLQFTDIRATEEGAIQLHWRSESNTLYRILYANELSDQTEWATLTDMYPSHGTNTFVLDAGDYLQTPYVLHPRYNPARFYRILNEGTNGAPPPQVAITDPTTGSVAFGNVTVTVTASTDQAALGTTLYVDGQQMHPAFESTNYSANGTNYVADSYLINSCEWPNGSHTFFAVAECVSDFAGPLNVTPVAMGHAVSAYVPVTFSNLITRYSWSEPFFRPDLGQTQIVSAVFAANVDWTLQILNASSNAVRTVTGSGSAMEFPWDGTGDGGTNLPAGVYTYLLSAQTNGGAFSMMSPLGSVSSSAGSVSSAASEDSKELWAMPGEGPGDPVPLVLFPPDYDTNGFLIFEASESEMLALYRSIGGLPSEPVIDNGPESAFGGPSGQTTSGPTRPPTAPMLNIVGSYGVAYQSYVNPSGSGIFLYPTMLPPLDGQPYPPGHRVSLFGSGTSAAQIVPLLQNGGEKFNFDYEMRYKGGWWAGFSKRDEQLYGSDLRGAGSPFNTNNIGLLLLHGIYGTSADWYADQCQQIYFPLWSFGPQLDGTVTSREEWVRMSEMDFGSDSLKWMAIKACYSLHQDNVSSMDAHFIYPFNSNLHFMLGFDTVCYEDLGFSAKWANLMIKSNLTVYAAWVEAGGKSFVGVPGTIRAAIWGHSGNFGGHITDYTSSSSGGLDYLTDQVHP